MAENKEHTLKRRIVNYYILRFEWKLCILFFKIEIQRFVIQTKTTNDLCTHLNYIFTVCFLFLKYWILLETVLHRDFKNVLADNGTLTDRYAD